MARSPTPASHAVPQDPRRALFGGWRDWGAGLALAVLVLAVYVPVWRCGFIWDDDDYITENLSLRTPGGLSSIWTDPRATPQYYPLVHTTFWVEYQLWGLRPAGYHAVNVICHALGSVLLWRVLSKLQVPAAWMTAALFGVHPVQVESVAWVTERKNVLAGVFYFLALLSAVEAARLDSRPDDSAAPRWGPWLLTGLWFLCALLSKSIACTLPATILLLIYWKRGRLTRSDLQTWAPFFVLGALFAWNTARLERTQVGAVGEAFQWSLAERCLIAGRAIWHYAGELLWPANLCFSEPRWPIDASRPGEWMLFVSALLVPIVLWRARFRIGRGPLVACLYFGGSLLPALGFFNIYPMRYSYVADHFQYLACIGLLALVCGGLDITIRNWPANSVVKSGRTPAPLWITAAVILAVCSVLTIRREAVFQNSETLWTDVLRQHPASFIAHYHLALVRSREGRHAEAARHFEQALRYETDHLETADTWALLGNCRMRAGDVPGALSAFDEALALRPAHVPALNGRGNVSARLGRHDDAATAYRAALDAAPDAAAIWMNLGNAQAMLGQLDAAELSYRESLRRAPEHAPCLVNLGNVLARQRRFREAADIYAHALRLDPASPGVQQRLSEMLRNEAMKDAR